MECKKTKYSTFKNRPGLYIGHCILYRQDIGRIFTHGELPMPSEYGVTNIHTHLTGLFYGKAIGKYIGWLKFRTLVIVLRFGPFLANLQPK